MTKLILLEDEPAAMRRLKRMITEIRPDWSIIGAAESVEEGFNLIKKNNYDLIISDIQLSDGLCFEIFEQTPPKKPIIFLTAWDDYAIKAFEFNSLHYLLKPIVLEKLNLAFSKFENQQIPATFNLESFLPAKNTEYKSRIISKVGKKTVLIEPGDIAIIHVYDGYTKAILFNTREHLLDYSLDSITQYLPEATFFRINRQCIINKKTIATFESHTSNRLLLNLNIHSDLEFVVSKEKTPVFKKWILIE